MEKFTAEIVKHLDPDVLADFGKAALNAETADDFVNAIMIGDCPKCSSTNLVSCEQDPDIDNPCIAHCFDCGVYWCTECRKPLSAKEYDTHHDTCPEMKYLEPPDDFPDDFLDGGESPG